eukprot:TRINITY_DN2878_c0_g1_i1.p1 TRINITY_DN2878_c0_g1~~TRINITY_DN2878_c0_g1_i1.p1  ORF type:complete len:725 (+),score=176.38 TRINITY_DN2878_c0_g1_i1:247-2421(+)
MMKSDSSERYPPSGSSNSGSAVKMDIASANPMLKKALEGRITEAEYAEAVRPLIRGENKKTESTTHVSISSHSIDFNSDKNLLPVVDFEDKAKWSAQNGIKIMNNNTKGSISYQVAMLDNPKVYVEWSPSTEIKPNAAAELYFDVRIFCTSKIWQVVQIHISKVGKKKILSSKKPKEEEIGTFYVVLKMQSELSSSLDYDDIGVGDKIGRGAYGVVYKGNYREEEIAIKVLNIEQLVEEELILVKRELANMSKTRNRYIVQFVGATLIKGQPVCLVMEYIKDGNLTAFLDKQPLSTYFKTKLALDVARGMAYLHSNNIGHRDLKSDNVLVFAVQEDAPVNLKITDFGTSKASLNQPRGNDLYAAYENFNLKTRMEVERNNSKNVGTLIYQAPEILEGSSNFVDSQIDVFSFGVLLWQIFAQVMPYSQPPYDKWDSREIAKFVTSGKRLPIPDNTPPEIAQLIVSCWENEPSSRPQFKNVVQILQKMEESLKNTRGSSSSTLSFRESSSAINGSLSPGSQLHSSNESSQSSYNTGSATQNPIAPQSMLTLTQSNSFGGNQSSGHVSMSQMPIASIGSSASSLPSVGSPTSSSSYRAIPTPPGRDMDAIGWHLDITRESATEKLQNTSRGSFLVRWSPARNSFVLSYQSGNGVKHIDSIYPKDGKVEVLRADNSRPMYDTMWDYIVTLRDIEKIVTVAVRPPAYDQSPANARSASSVPTHYTSNFH